MYLKHWGLAEKPFENTPDPKFLYHSAQHEEGLSRLLYVVREEKGAGLLTGVYGCGKTLLSRSLARELESDVYRVAFVTNPRLDATEMLRMILHLLGAGAPPDRKSDVLRALEENFLANIREGRKNVVVIDEAHAIEDPSIFEEIRLLLNFQTESRFLLTLLLLGQPELKPKIETSKQLNQRISMRFHLEGLNEGETASYVHHRLLIAGAKRPVFEEPALTLLYLRSGGIPRRINQICDMCLLTGMARRAETVNDAVLKESIESLEG
ncbi:MAG: hypothetical protein A2902_01395 [Elusimicrobia bacterium RIFCSPLOWO2_01_FULL_64_13]|nr:MAG: hypothetical protein A2636_00350 [Elusimicrobia bacterium RIFCSPHIGHO2_01_FULL_64_10]OGR97542.1 MAG: hypothetical protein A2902_01395 [Elusimicrobia bacterium RIFCSPLOWO2_01_FULL_64_13]